MNIIVDIVILYIMFLITVGFLLPVLSGVVISLISLIVAIGLFLVDTSLLIVELLVAALGQVCSFLSKVFRSIYSG